MSATSDILAKWQELKNRGLDLGAPVGPEQDAGFGGRFQQYEHSTIFWHNDIGTHEVHGGILTKYLESGGPGFNPKTGNRELGFPKTDEIRTEDSLYPVSHFEWGSIYWVSGTGGVSIHGDFYKIWKSSGAELGWFGYPITDHISVGDLEGALGTTHPLDLGHAIDRKPVRGEAVFFQRAWLFRGGPANAALLGSFNPPLLGATRTLNPDSEVERSLSNMLSFGVKESVWEAIQRDHPRLLTDLWGGQLVLQQVGKSTEEIPLTVELDRVQGGTEGELTMLRISLHGGDPTEPHAVPSDDRGVRVWLKLRPANGSALQDRTLYNVGFRYPNGRTYVLAPHAIYAKKSWDNCGFIHATDLHVSRRLEGFRRKLRELGQAEGANEYNNFNDSLRDLIRYANHLHEIGMIDFILATGDLVDYVFEEGDNRKGGGNFAFFEQLVRGQVPSPDGVGSEELRVAIFTVLGNHDYRPNSYKLTFNVNIGDIGPFDVITDKSPPLFVPHNLTQDEARALQGGHKPSLSPEEALPMVAIEEPSYYRKRINSEKSYIIPLGSHRIVMLDSNWDLGIPSSADDWALIKLGLDYLWGGLDEDTRRSGAGSPNSKGFDHYDLGLVSQALKEAGPQGLVMVGLHAPPLNPEASELSHYFRETEHPTADGNEVVGFLRRRDPLPFMNPQGSNPFSLHPDWVRTGTPYFKRGGIEDLLDDGIAMGETDRFLRLCVGEEAPRKVDLVLCGHHHDRVEFRLGVGSNREFLVHTDFYTENPTVYYPSLKVGIEGPVCISVVEGTSLNEKPIQTRDQRSEAFWTEWWSLKVPPYAMPLNSTSAHKAWWAQRRPLIMQTASLGPIDRNQRKDKELNKTPPVASFQGFRVISIADNVIAKCHYVTLAELRQRQFRMPWEPSISTPIPVPIVTAIPIPIVPPVPVPLR
jgi:hypothetical protein